MIFSQDVVSVLNRIFSRFARRWDSLIQSVKRERERIQSIIYASLKTGNHIDVVKKTTPNGDSAERNR